MPFNSRDIRGENTGAYNRFSISLLFFLSMLLMLRQFTSSNYFTVVMSDAFIYPSWAWQFKEALKEGIFYPRWLPLNFWGYGSPTFLLYPPLAYYLVALFDVFTGSIITAMNVVKFTALFLSGTGVYFLVKEFYPARAALLSAVFYVIFPYNIALMYIFGSFAAIVSCVWFSPILLFICRYCRSGKPVYLVLSGACYGALILTHLVIAYMFTFVMTALVLHLAVTGKRPGIIGALAAVLPTGFLLSAAYVLPVIFEKRFVSLDVFTSGRSGYIFSNMFLLPDLTARFSDQGSFWPVYYGTLVLYAVIFCLFTMLFLLTSIKYRKSTDCGNTHVINTFFLAAAVCSMLLMFGVSSFLWETIPFFKYILFPTRWMDITALAVSFLSASLFVTMPSRSGTGIRLLMVQLLLLSCFAWDLYYIIGAPTYDKRAPIAVNTVIEHLPKGVRLDKIDKQETEKAPGFIVQGAATAHAPSWRSTERVVDVKAERPVVVRFRTFNFPGWCAFVDGTQTEISEEAGTRAILVNVPKGNHRLELIFRDTPVRLAGKLISLASVTALVVILAAKKTGPGKAV